MGKTEDLFGDLPVLETERLVLRKITLADAEDMFAYASDPEMTHYTSWLPHESIDESRLIIAAMIEQCNNKEVLTWGVVHKADNKLIGTCGFLHWLAKHARAELAYALARKYWRKGYTTEAARGAVDFGFRTMQLHRLEARCRIENVASARVMEKLGMKFEGVLREYMFIKGAHHDFKLYSILQREWTT